MSKPPLTRRSFLERNVIASAGAGLAGVALQGAAAAPQGAIIPTELEAGQKLRVGIWLRKPQQSAYRRRQSLCRADGDYGAVRHPARDAGRKTATGEGGAARVYRDYEEMLKDDDLDAVIIVLPNTLHREGAVAALDAGKHVLCEKPLSIDVADTKQIIAAADRSRRVLQVGTQSRHSPGYQALASKIHDGLIGNVLYGWNQTFRADWRKIYPDPEQDARLNWRMKQAEGGSVVYEMGIHLIDVFNWFINSDVEEVSCLGGTHNKRLQKRDSWDHAGLVVRYTNGAMMTYGGNLYSCGGPGPNILFGDGGTLELGGRDADKAILRKRPYWRPHNTVESPSGGSEDVTLPKGALDTTFLQYEYFLESVQGKKPVFPSARDHLAAVQIARGSQMSAAEHRHVKASEIP